jgi:Mg-chelatase subunit ChlD
MKKVLSIGIGMLLLLVGFFTGINGFYVNAASESNNITFNIGPVNPSAISLQGEVKNVTSDGKNVVPDPSNVFTVSKGLDGSPAKAEVNYQLTPSGKPESVTRKPVDVVFIFDTSGSMTQSRLTKARQAAQNAINRFTVPGDQVGLVSFSTTVNTALDLTINFSAIKNKIATFTQGNGGTNYTEALKKAKDILSNSSKPQNEKYIIFMTDGEPTVQDRGDGYYDVLTTNNQAYKAYVSRGEILRYVALLNYKDTDKSIRDRAKSVAGDLRSAAIQMHSIGLEIDKEENRAYLKSLSDITGGTTMQGTEDELDKMFNSVVNQINNVNLTEVKVQIKLTSGITVDETRYPNVKTEVIGGDRYAVISVNPIAFNSTGPISAENPNGLSAEQLEQIAANLRQTLPLLFSEAGEYTFDRAHNSEMVLTYKDVKGQPVTKDIPAITIKVVDPRIPATGLVLDKLDLELEVNPYAAPDYNKHEKTLTATIVPGNATNQIIQWTSKDPSIAEVVGNGKTVTIRAKRPGKTEIVALVNEKLENGQMLPPAICKVHVNMHPVFEGKAESIHHSVYAYVVPKVHTILPDPGAPTNNDALETRWYMQLPDGTWHIFERDNRIIKGYFDRKDIFYNFSEDKDRIPFGIWALTVDKTLPADLSPEDIVTQKKEAVFGELKKATIESEYLEKNDITNFISPIDSGSTSSSGDNRAAKVSAGYRILKVPDIVDLSIQQAGITLVPMSTGAVNSTKEIPLETHSGKLLSSVLQPNKQPAFVKSKLLKAPGKSIKYNIRVKMLVKLEPKSGGFDFSNAPPGVIREIPIEKNVGSLEVKGSNNLN